MVLVVISIGVFLAYVLGVCIGFGYIPNSISASYYWLENKKKNLGVLFTLFCWGTAVPMLVYMLDVTSESLQFLAFIACASLCFVGAAPMFRNESEGKVHRYGTAVAMVSISTWIIFMRWWVLLLAVGSYAAGIIVHMAKNRIAVFDPYFINKVKPMFWGECAMYAAVYLTAMLV